MANAPISIPQLRAKVNDLSAALDADADLERCASMLLECKIALTTLPGLQPGVPISQDILPDITLARDVYEIATLLSLKQEDEVAFERHVAQAKTYYVDFGTVIPPSGRQNLILGLNLMRLMAQNRIGEFHTELELVPSDAREDTYIKYALKLENCLMEGSYSKIREEGISAPHPSFNFFVDNLMITVREEIADCSQKAYTSLAADSAMRMMSIASEEELQEFCEGRNWRLEGGFIYFSAKDAGKGDVEQIPSSEMIKRSLVYARELEQII